MTTTVLYIGGTGRSGSTVLANLLGEADGYVSVGEIRFMWERGLGENRLCGCGEHFSDCAFWQSVLRSAYPDGVPDPATVIPLLQEQTRMRQLPALMAHHDDDALAKILTPLYEAIAEVAGASVVIDSSKLPTYASVIDRMPSLDVLMVHLVRDPRAAAFSWKRVKELPDKGSRRVMERRGVLKSTGLWSVWNSALEWMWRDRPDKYVRVAYEDLVSSPEAQLRLIMSGLQLEGAPWQALTGPGTARLSVHHTVAGNPSRMAQGSVTLRLDDEWQQAMPSMDRATVQTLAGPVMHRYGYRRSKQSTSAAAS